VDSQGSAYATGTTASPNYPVTPGAYDPSFNGASDAFVTKLNPAGSALVYSTFLGGLGGDDGNDIAVDAQGSIYLTGGTPSPNYPVTPEAYDPTFNGVADAFVTKLTLAPPGAATVTLSPPTAVNPVGASHTVTATASDSSGQPVEDVTILFAVTGSTSTSGSCTTGANGQCDFTYQGPELPGEDLITGCADNDDNGSTDPEEPCGTATKTWVVPPSTPLCDVIINDGGFITANNGDRGSFGGNAHVSQTSAVTGHQTYQDHGPAQPMRVQSTALLAVTCSQDQTQAAIFGQATVDGVGSFLFRVDLRDLGEPGTGRDRYRILISNGYDSGDHPLEGGNIQIH
jgi:hypothetical protein